MGLIEQVIREQEEAKRALCDRVRDNLLDAIEILADTARHPLNARDKLERSRPFLREAMRAAIEMDPHESPDYGKDDEYHPPHGPVTNHDLTEDQRLDAQVNR